MDPLKKIKFVLGLNFSILFIFILSIPFFIKNDTRWASAEITETFFIAIGLVALIYLFRHYDYLMQKREEEAILLDVKLKKKEKELLDAFQYLGKVNVQFSMIKDLIRKREMPTTKSQLKRAYMEILSLACSITRSHFSVLKIIDLESERTLHENSFNLKNEEEDISFKIRNNEVIESIKNNNNYFVIDGMAIFTSKSENFNIKALVCVPQKEIEHKKEEKDFLEAIANQ
ncbi:MAG: hypothetical protein PF549_01860, partial [Patescibacteria group bacterium]|nr:hypothetical protein [Patescibacteria group bacterium]